MWSRTVLTSSSREPRKYWCTCASARGLARSTTSSLSLSVLLCGSKTIGGAFQQGSWVVATVEVTCSAARPRRTRTQALGFPRSPLPSLYARSEAALIQTRRIPRPRPVMPRSAGSSEKDGSLLSRARSSGRCIVCIPACSAASGPRPGSQPKKASSLQRCSGAAAASALRQRSRCWGLWRLEYSRWSSKRLTSASSKEGSARSWRAARASCSCSRPCSGWPSSSLFSQPWKGSLRQGSASRSLSSASTLRRCPGLSLSSDMAPCCTTGSCLWESRRQP
mmetsp:Transcript_1698/g.5805  ORF Transcript_1698/g.5805 Transcript_1698/m.5805 type:complete len:279 (-) Transcript_1698:203-1039(-)